ncbi:hypothetical protein [Virgibacillus sp. SK37]|uniref:hypothetical protein n=1 Tax=Virgibacillus sp. SK37 TaxID=403957 RepID=UPI0012EBB800|nr:hypothetical protein [Virgibacillus sp. SK37]
MAKIKILQLVYFIICFSFFHRLLGSIYFYSSPVDSILISLLGYLLVFLLAITTTIITFYYAKKAYGK